MTRQLLIDITLEHLEKLRDHKVREVSDFAKFLLHRLDGQLLIEGIQKLTSEADAFKFLENEPDLYSLKDLKERYQ